MRALSSLRGLRGAPAVPPLCRETQSLGQQMLNATVGINGLNWMAAKVSNNFYYFKRRIVYLLKLERKKIIVFLVYKISSFKEISIFWRKLVEIHFFFSSKYLKFEEKCEKITSFEAKNTHFLAEVRSSNYFRLDFIS